jgi:tetratricopeptide (TPR) repeat protein
VGVEEAAAWIAKGTTRGMETLSDNLKQEAGAQPLETIKRLLAQIRTVQQKAEPASSGAEATDPKSPDASFDILEIDGFRSNNHQTDQPAISLGNPPALLDQGKQQFEKGDFAACFACMREAHHLDPDNAEAEWYLKESARQMEEQRLQEELEIHIENVKKEATDSFDQQRYRECIGMFQFLCELEPDNRKLHDYLELSQQFVRETEAAREKASQTFASWVSQETGPEKLLTSETVASPSSSAAAEPPQVELQARNCQLEAARDDGQQNIPSAPLAPEKSGEQPQVMPSKSPCRSGNETARDVEIEIESSDRFSRKKRRAVLLVAAAVLLLAMVKGRMLPHRWQELTRSPAVQPDLGQAPAPIDTKGKVEKGKAASVAPPLVNPNPEGMPNHSQGSKPDLKKSFRGAVSGNSLVGNPVQQARQPALIYPVIHDHVLGSCTGSLRIDSKSIAFVPAEDSKDGFNFKLTDITGTELGDKLKIKFGNKIYRFKASLATNKEDNRGRLNAIYQLLARFRAGLQ